jgi:nucleotide-binding universal stress UspA family protein
MVQWKWNKIIVGVDGSKDSLRALNWACEEAKRAGVPLVAVSVWTVPPAPSAPPFGSFPWGVSVEIGDATRSMLQQAVDDAEAEFPRVDISLYVVAGNAALELIRLSETADEVVVGAKGHGGFTGMLIGSVSQHVLAHSACTVVVVR